MSMVSPFFMEHGVVVSSSTKHGAKDLDIITVLQILLGEFVMTRPIQVIAKLVQCICMNHEFRRIF